MIKLRIPKPLARLARKTIRKTIRKAAATTKRVAKRTAYRTGNKLFGNTYTSVAKRARQPRKANGQFAPKPRGWR